MFRSARPPGSPSGGPKPENTVSPPLIFHFNPQSKLTFTWFLKARCIRNQEVYAKFYGDNIPQLYLCNLEMTFGSGLRLMIDRWIGVHLRLSWMPHHSGCEFLRAPMYTRRLCCWFTWFSRWSQRSPAKPLISVDWYGVSLGWIDYSSSRPTEEFVLFRISAA